MKISKMNRCLIAIPLVAVLGAMSFPGSAARAATAPEAGQLPVTSGTIEVTATRIAEDVSVVPAAVTVVSGKEARARGARTLAQALSLVGGVAIAPGGDGGPAGGVPELWGLRELDAYLLVVDGVPRGGAFLPDLESIDLTGVERIEVLRGAAPVMFGATSFVGVIQVIHFAAGKGERQAEIWGGSHSSGGASVTSPLSAIGANGAYRQSLSVSYAKRGYRDPRTDFKRSHLLYRGALSTSRGSLRFDVDGVILRQSPDSPRPRGAFGLAPTAVIPLDANLNPSDAKLDHDRLETILGWTQKLWGGEWRTTLSFAHGSRDIVRGFVRPELVIGADGNNADGYRQNQKQTDVYFDSHLALEPNPATSIVVGVDHLYGAGSQRSANFAYIANLSGLNEPASSSRPIDERTELNDRRNFSGLYGELQWHPTPRWHFEAGARLNHTRESQEGDVISSDAGQEEEGGASHRTDTRLSGVLGANVLAWGTEQSAIWAFADLRSSFKPAVVDFGPEAEGEILEPETAKSAEVGLKGTFLGGKINWQATAFQMDFSNLVLSQVGPSGLPRLANAGKQRFRGVELEGKWMIFPRLTWHLAGSLHDSRFRDYQRLADGIPQQLTGNRLALAPRVLASTGLIYAPSRGLGGWVTAARVGNRYLDQTNHVLAPAYNSWDAGVSYGWRSWKLRIDGHNLNDARPPVAESELGDASYYLLPSRSLLLTVARSF